MLDLLASLFRDSTPSTAEAAPSGDVALAALLVEAARQDDTFDEVERAAILRVLALEFGLDRDGASALLAKAEAAQSDAVGVFRFTHALKEATPFEERSRIIEHLWEIVLADGERDATEDALIRKLCGLLGVPDRESGLARHRAQERLADATRD